MTRFQDARLHNNTVFVRPPERELSQPAAAPFAETGS